MADINDLQVNAEKMEQNPINTPATAEEKKETVDSEKKIDEVQIQAPVNQDEEVVNVPNILTMPGEKTSETSKKIIKKKNIKITEESKGYRTTGNMKKDLERTALMHGLNKTQMDRAIMKYSEFWPIDMGLGEALTFVRKEYKNFIQEEVLREEERIRKELAEEEEEEEGEEEEESLDYESAKEEIDADAIKDDKKQSETEMEAMTNMLYVPNTTKPCRCMEFDGTFARCRQTTYLPSATHKPIYYLQNHHLWGLLSMTLNIDYDKLFHSHYQTMTEGARNVFSAIESCSSTLSNDNLAIMNHNGTFKISGMKHDDVLKWFMNNYQECYFDRLAGFYGYYYYRLIVLNKSATTDPIMLDRWRELISRFDQERKEMLLPKDRVRSLLDLPISCLVCTELFYNYSEYSLHNCFYTCEKGDKCAEAGFHSRHQGAKPSNFMLDKGSRDDVILNFGTWKFPYFMYSDFELARVKVQVVDNKDYHRLKADLDEKRHEMEILPYSHSIYPSTLQCKLPLHTTSEYTGMVYCIMDYATNDILGWMNLEGKLVRPNKEKCTFWNIFLDPLTGWAIIKRRSCNNKGCHCHFTSVRFPCEPLLYFIGNELSKIDYKMPQNVTLFTDSAYTRTCMMAVNSYHSYEIEFMAEKKDAYITFAISLMFSIAFIAINPIFGIFYTLFISPISISLVWYGIKHWFNDKFERYKKPFIAFLAFTGLALLIYAIYRTYKKHKAKNHNHNNQSNGICDKCISLGFVNEGNEDRFKPGKARVTSASFELAEGVFSIVGTVLQEQDANLFDISAESYKRLAALMHSSAQIARSSDVLVKAIATNEAGPATEPEDLFEKMVEEGGYWGKLAKKMKRKIRIVKRNVEKPYIRWTLSILAALAGLGVGVMIYKLWKRHTKVKETIVNEGKGAKHKHRRDVEEQAQDEKDIHDAAERQAKFDYYNTPITAEQYEQIAPKYGPSYKEMNEEKARRRKFMDHEISASLKKLQVPFTSEIVNEMPNITKRNYTFQDVLQYPTVTVRVANHNYVLQWDKYNKDPIAKQSVLTSINAAAAKHTTPDYTGSLLLYTGDYHKGEGFWTRVHAAVKTNVKNEALMRVNGLAVNSPMPLIEHDFRQAGFIPEDFKTNAEVLDKSGVSYGVIYGIICPDIEPDIPHQLIKDVDNDIISLCNKMRSQMQEIRKINQSVPRQVNEGRFEGTNVLNIAKVFRSIYCIYNTKHRHWANAFRVQMLKDNKPIVEWVTVCHALTDIPNSPGVEPEKTVISQMGSGMFSLKEYSKDWDVATLSNPYITSEGKMRDLENKPALVAYPDPEYHGVGFVLAYAFEGGQPVMKVSAQWVIMRQGIIDHHIATDPGFSGAPILSCDGRVLGIHQCSTGLSNRGVSIEYALIPSARSYKTRNEAMKVISPIPFEDDYKNQGGKDEIEEHALEDPEIKIAKELLEESDKLDIRRDYTERYEKFLIDSIDNVPNISVNTIVNDMITLVCEEEQLFNITEIRLSFFEAISNTIIAYREFCYECRRDHNTKDRRYILKLLLDTYYILFKGMMRGDLNMMSASTRDLPGIYVLMATIRAYTSGVQTIVDEQQYDINAKGGSKVEYDMIKDNQNKFYEVSPGSYYMTKEFREEIESFIKAGMHGGHYKRKSIRLDTSVIANRELLSDYLMKIYNSRDFAKRVLEKYYEHPMVNYNRWIHESAGNKLDNEATNEEFERLNTEYINLDTPYKKSMWSALSAEKRIRALNCLPKLRCNFDYLPEEQRPKIDYEVNEENIPIEFLDPHYKGNWMPIGIVPMHTKYESKILDMSNFISVLAEESDFPKPKVEYAPTIQKKETNLKDARKYLRRYSANADTYKGSMSEIPWNPDYNTQFAAIAALDRKMTKNKAYGKMMHVDEARATLNPTAAIGWPQKSHSPTVGEYFKDPKNVEATHEFIRMIEQGLTPTVVSEQVLKDELRDLSRVLDLKGRSFNSESKFKVLLQKILFQELFEYLTGLPVTCKNSSNGWSPFYGGWDDLVRWLEACGPVVNNMDYPKWDSTVHSSARAYVEEVYINRVLEAHYNKDKLFKYQLDTDVYCRVCVVYIGNGRGLIYLVFQGISSGGYITLQENSDVNFYRHAYCLIRLLKDQIKVKVGKDNFDEELDRILAFCNFLGDDAIYSKDPSYIYDDALYAQFSAEIGFILESWRIGEPIEFAGVLNHKEGHMNFFVPNYDKMYASLFRVKKGTNYMDYLSKIDSYVQLIAGCNPELCKKLIKFRDTVASIVRNFPTINQKKLDSLTTFDAARAMHFPINEATKQEKDPKLSDKQRQALYEFRQMRIEAVKNQKVRTVEDMCTKKLQFSPKSMRLADINDRYWLYTNFRKEKFHSMLTNLQCYNEREFNNIICGVTPKEKPLREAQYELKTSCGDETITYNEFHGALHPDRTIVFHLD